MSGLGPNLAGGWYPADADALRRELDAALAVADSPPRRSADTRASGAVRGLIAPHAGLVYSGPTAACAFRRIEGARPRRVVLIGPSHYAAYPGIALPTAERYRTPLGETPIDVRAVGELAASPGMQVTDEPFAREHSLEMELIFLQRVLERGFALVPLLVGAGSPERELSAAAAALANLWEPNTLWVVSSDFTHFGRRFGYTPFHDDVPGCIERLDRGALDRILELDRQGFDDYVSRTGATICGRQPISVLLRLAPRDLHVRWTGYDTSGRITGDWSHTVSYAGLVFEEPGA